MPPVLRIWKIPESSDSLIPEGRLLVTWLALGPLAFFMGAPFPLGLRTVSQADPRRVVLAWGVNGFMSVVGSAGGIALAILAGYQAVLAAAALTYLVAAGVALKMTGRG